VMKKWGFIGGWEGQIKVNGWRNRGFLKKQAGGIFGRLAMLSMFCLGWGFWASASYNVHKQC
jgi:hypothetical protein